MSSDICFLARFAYSHGQDPIDYASSLVQMHIEVNLMVRAARYEDPATFPGYLLDLSLEALSRRVIGDLMDAGWTPPEVTP